MPQTPTRSNNQTSNTQTETASQSDGGQNSKTKRGMGCCLMKLFLMLALAVAGIGVAYVLNRNSSDDKFNNYIDEVVAGGTPLIVGEVVQRNYSLRQGHLDTSKEWAVIIQDFGSDEYRDSITDVPHLGVQSLTRWPPVKWNDFEKAKQFLDENRKQLLQLQLACSGTPFLHSELGSDSEFPAESLNAINRAWDFLELSCYVAAHEREPEDLAIRLIGCLKFSQCLDLHPGVQMQRLELEKRGLEFLLPAISRIEFPEKELERMRNVVMNMANWSHVKAWWQYERAVRLMMYNDLDKFRETGLFQQIQQNPKQADFLKNLDINMKYSPFSGDDAIAFLEHMNSIEQLFDGNPLDAATRISELEQSIWQSASSGLEKYKTPTARLMVPKVSTFVQATGEVAAIRNVALAALAVDQFQLSQQKLPSSLNEACEDFLNEVPSDLYVNSAISMRPSQAKTTVSSVGPNQVDDEPKKDDIEVVLPLQKWNASPDSLRKAR